MTPLLTHFRPRAYAQHMAAVARFLIRPRAVYAPCDWRDAAGALPVLLILKLLLVILAALGFYGFEAAGFVPPLENRLGSLDWPAWQLILVGGLVVPLLEEGAFRAHFRMQRWSLAVTTACLAFLAVSYLSVGDTALREGLYEGAAPARYMLALFIGGTVYAAAGHCRLLLWLQAKWRRHFKAIFWLSLLAFGLMHLERYGNFSWGEHGLFVPLIILPQVIAASFYTYARMRYGFGWAVALHGFNNALPVILFDVLITGPLDAVGL